MVKTVKKPAKGKAKGDKSKDAKASKSAVKAAKPAKPAAAKAALKASKAAGKAPSKAAAKTASKTASKTAGKAASKASAKIPEKSALPAKSPAKSVSKPAVGQTKLAPKTATVKAAGKTPAAKLPAASAKSVAPKPAGSKASSPSKTKATVSPPAKPAVPPPAKPLVAKVETAKLESVKPDAPPTIAAKPAKRAVRAVPARLRADASLRKTADTLLPDSAPIRTPLSKAEIKLDPNYRPTDQESFMNDHQREYFRRKLIAWKEDILREAKETLAALQAENENHPDLADRASSETDRAIELRARDRQRKLIAKIDAAIARIEDGSYGYCEETGEPISLRRLEARPIATLSIEAQERHERAEKVHRDD